MNYCIDDRSFRLEFLGAFLGAALVFGVYYSAINHFDGGIRQVEKINRISLKKDR